MDTIIPTNVNYNSSILNKNLQTLKSLYPFLEVGTAGKSIIGQDIPYVKIGNGQKQVFYSASIHANEWITSVVLMKFLEDYCYSYVNNLPIGGYPARLLFNIATIYIMPMVNPDGVDLVTGFFKKGTWAYDFSENIAYQFATIPFPSGWKANIRGVDLKNCQPVCKVL